MGWPLHGLAGWLTLLLSGSRCPIVCSWNLVGWPLRSLAGRLTLQRSGYRCPIVGIPFTGILSQAVLLLHLCPDGPTNIVKNYRLYAVWTIGPRLGLPGKKVFSVSDHLSVLENRWVRVLANLLLRQA